MVERSLVSSNLTLSTTFMNYYERALMPRRNPNEHRRDFKRRKDAYRLEVKNRPSDICRHCGGHMTWCESCRMYSSNCCEDYGSCLCS